MSQHTLRVWIAVGFITLGLAEIMVVSTIYAMKREMSEALTRLERELPDRPGVGAVAKLIYGAGFLAVRNTVAAYALGLFSVLVGVVILILEHLYGG
jgi:hypothetical protein